MPSAMVVSMLLLQLDTAEPVFRTQAVDARVDVRVTRDGKPVVGLTASDFVVTDNRREYRVTGIAAEEQPLDVLLVLDMSRSMQQWIELLAEYSESALALMRPSDRVAVATFADDYNVRAELSSNFDATIAAVDKAAAAKPGPNTMLDDAIRRSALYIARRGRPAARRAVVLITDNLSPADREPETLKNDVLRSEAVFVALLPPMQSGSITLRSRTTRVHSDVRRFVEATGGDTIASTTDRGPALAECIQRLRQRYTVYFRPDGDLPSDISVKLSTAAQTKYPGAEVRASVSRR